MPVATFDSAETVALLAPGSVYGSTVGMSAAGLSLFGALGNAEDSRVLSTQACSDGGQVVFLGRRDEDLHSPYNGGLFDVVTTDDRNCQEGDLTSPSGFAETNTEGERRIGYPVNADPVKADVFAAYELSGVSLEEPFSVTLRTESGSGLEWSRYWDGHVELRRGVGQDSLLGDGGGATRLYQVSRIRSGGNDGIGYDLQTGTGADDRFEMSFQAITDRPASEYREERYSGVFGLRFLDGDGQSIDGACPAGRYRVSTDGLTVDLARGENAEFLLFGDTQSIVSGALTMEDEAGNTAQVVYDGVDGSVTVTLNQGVAESFTYQALNDALLARCYSARR
ncbi:hypothetical protein [Alcanivorax hongdengensis]|uniref:hypothetical protein n=1 Tax=Alcanivorax hongdengensis TaxID=519051 RepID=UPI0012F7F2A6|nr:hypothetical protein [Alcanivorax hongdengensis]